ncbi:MAG: hypothetical protein QOE51_2087 [Actinoplanes sp.]|nr:hypothetical protein [Actinoplanes sp.]
MVVDGTGEDDGVTDDPPPDDGPEAPQPRDRLARFERLAEHDFRRMTMPAWLRHTDGEQRWPSALTIAVMIGLQISLPGELSIWTRWALIAVEALIIVMLVVKNPGRLHQGSPHLRRLSLALIAVASLVNGWSAAWLVQDIVLGRDTGSAGHLLASGGNVWLINVLTFAVWYWELDRGGPAERALGSHPIPDFLFPQMSTPDMAPVDWEPEFLDYLYLAFTNSMAFSPTDTLPLSRWAKSTMLLQSAISLVVAALVVAKAVNAFQ